MDILKGRECLSYEERLRAGTVQSGEEKAQGHLSNVYKYPKGGCKLNSQALFIGIRLHDQRQQALAETQDVRKHFFPL